MFCHQCGTELRENARFCYNCGAPARESSEQAGSAAISNETALLTTASSDSSNETDTQTTASPDDSNEAESQTTVSPYGSNEAETQTTASPNDSNETESLTTASPYGSNEAETQTTASPNDSNETKPQTAVSSTDTKNAPPQETSDAGTPADLILKKGKVVVTDKELRLNRKHYIRKPGKKKFKKEKEPALLPLDSILGTSTEHHKYGGRIFLSLLLLVCFAAGVLFSARYGYETYNELNTPYRDKELAEQESILAIIDNDGAGQLLQYQNAQKENRVNAETLSAKLDELKARQTQEILAAVYNSDRFDLDDFFNRELFSHAYQEYLQDLLDAFKEDESLHSWFYSYYETTKAYGGNYFLNTDMWIYSDNGENRFSSDLDSASSLMDEQYDLDLYEHILYTGRIYITGADFMREVLSLPRYTVDGAVFVKAYGGTPDTTAMSVPGWGKSHYEEFWLYGTDYYTIDTPMWLDYGLPAENFDIDWNALTNEDAYYEAYQNFMDKIAPNLPRYEMVSYHADNAAYGGMGCDIKGTEASLSDIVTCYAENHPEFIEELKENQNYSKILTTSVDEEIADTEEQLEELENEFLDLQDQERELAQILEAADIHRSNYAFLLADIEQHTQELTNLLLLFSGAALLCLLAALLCLCKFFSFLKRPRHLFIISRQDMEYAFNTRHYSKDQITALQMRLPGQDYASEDSCKTK